jgi:hypothetical protein
MDEDFKALKKALGKVHDALDAFHVKALKAVKDHGKNAGLTDEAIAALVTPKEPK